MKFHCIYPVSLRDIPSNSTPLSTLAKSRMKKLNTYHTLRSEGCSEATVLETLEVSRATLYRWKARLKKRGPRGLEPHSRQPKKLRQRTHSRRDEQRVIELREKYPYFGRKKIHAMLRRQGDFNLSESTVGRILTHAVRLNRIRPCAFYQGRIKPKRQRNFQQGHAQRWKYGSRASQPGELVQIDHMSVVIDGITLKEFKAISPFDKYLVARCYTRATAFNARRFLRHVIQQMPFPLRSIQVDGGSEFMAEFEDECQALDIPLLVLPPRKPQFNGTVERSNLTTRTEFWNFYTGELNVACVNPALEQYLDFYHRDRPHQSLDNQTPMEYLCSLQAA